jgi:hypothetical protein
VRYARAFCYQGTTVDEDHTVCQAIRFFQVLRRQEDGHPVGDQVSDGLPENLSPTWIEASRWLVQEDDPGLAHEGHRKIETTAHASGVRNHRSIRCLGQLEALQVSCRSLQRNSPPQVVQPSHQGKVLSAGQELVHGRELAGDTDRCPDGLWRCHDIVTEHGRLASVRSKKRREDANRRRLP